MTLHEGSEPYMTVAVAGAREINGITVAVINLKLIWDVISAIHVGQSGDAFVLDRSGRLVAHPDISLVLRGDDDPAAARLKDTAAGGDRRRRRDRRRRQCRGPPGHRRYGADPWPGLDGVCRAAGLGGLDADPGSAVANRIFCCSPARPSPPSSLTCWRGA